MNDYLLKKKPFYALLIFAMPMIIGNLFQQGYTMVDSAIVGRYVSEEALAAVGASNALTHIFICVAMGGGIGASVNVSRYFGAGDFSKMKTAVNTALISFLALSLTLASVGLLMGKQFMIWLNTPAEAMDLAVLYLNIYFLGLPLMFMYNVLSAMFNALGKSRIPLIFLIVSSLLNVVLDYHMVCNMNLGVAGAAWATLIAQGISALLSFVVFLKELKYYEGKAERFFDLPEMLSMGRIALPSILQQSTITIGMLLVQSVVNGFGTQALAGFSAAGRIEAICAVPMTAIGNALSSYTAQNLGAKQKDRVVEGYRAANWMVAGFALLICVVSQLYYEPIIAFFLGENGTAVSLRTGQDAMRFLSCFYLILGSKMAVDGVLRGSGDVRMFTVANLVNMTIRVIFSMTMAPRFGIAMVWLADPIGWFANWIISFGQYRTGKWKTIKESSV